MQKNNNEITLAEIWKKIWANKTLITIITFILSIVIIISLFYLNKSSKKIVNKFTYDFINIENNKYPDNTSFDQKIFKDLNFLKTVARSDEKFSLINIDQMVLNEDVIVYKNVLSKSDEVTHYYYEINIPLKYFENNYGLAKEFINQIHIHFQTYVKDKNATLLINDKFKLINDTDPELINELTYSQILSLIEEQHKMINDYFKIFNQEYGRVAVNNVQIASIFNKYNLWYQNIANIKYLKGELIANQYLRPGSSEEILTIKQNELIMLNSYVTNKTATLNSLRDKYLDIYGNNIFVEDNELALLYNELALELIELENKITEVENLIDAIVNNVASENNTFEQNVKRVIVNQTNHLNSLNNIIKEFFDQSTNYATYGQTNFLLASRLNLKLYAVLAILGSGVVTISIVLFRESYLNNKKELTK